MKSYGDSGIHTRRDYIWVLVLPNAFDLAEMNDFSNHPSLDRSMTADSCARPYEWDAPEQEIRGHLYIGASPGRLQVYSAFFAEATKLLL